MPTPTGYACNICGANFDTLGEAAKCEAKGKPDPEELPCPGEIHGHRQTDGTVWLFAVGRAFIEGHEIRVRGYECSNDEYERFDELVKRNNEGLYFGDMFPRELYHHPGNAPIDTSSKSYQHLARRLELHKIIAVPVQPPEPPPPGPNADEIAEALLTVPNLANEVYYKLLAQGWKFVGPNADGTWPENA